MSSSPRKTFSRRQFVKKAAAASTVFAVPTIVPSSALGLDGFVAPSEKIMLGGIGIRSRGSVVLREMFKQPDMRFVAIADVRADQRTNVKEWADRENGDKQCSMYRDFRELLERDDIDAVLIATGDRWHGPASILAAEAGKDVYSEKPCTITIELAQTLAETMRRTGRVFQAGTQRRTVSNFVHAVNLARSGKLGNIKRLHASIYHLEDRHDWLPAQEEPPVEEIDWDMWLGPAPWRPYNREYVDGGWRGFHDFDSGAKLLDWGAHTLDLCQWANDSDDTIPIEYEPMPEIPNDNVIVCRYANGVEAVLRRSGWNGLGSCPVKFEGDEGWIETGDTGRSLVSLDSLRMSMPIPPKEIGTTPTFHVRNFFDCVKSRAKTATNADIARKSHIACHAAAIAWILQRKLKMDPVTETFIDDEEANRMRGRAAREPWTV